MNVANNGTDSRLPGPEEEISLGGDGGGKMLQPSELIELFQVSHLRSQSAHYTLFDGRFLSVHQKRPWKKARRYWLDLGFLDPTPHLLSITDWRSLYLAGGFATAWLFMIALSAVVTTPLLQQPWLPVTIALGCATLVALGMFFLRSRNLVRFHSLSGDAVFLELVNNAPSRTEFATFLRTLIQQIQKAGRSDPRKAYQKLGAELCEHRRLLEKAVLSQDAYDYAREKILRRHRQASARAVKQPARLSAPAHAAEGEVIEVTLANGGWQVSEQKRRA